IAAATLSDRYIADRHLPDKAIDLVDEAASRLRMEIDSMPTEIDEATRQLTRMQIEATALSQEKGTESKERLATLQRQIADREEDSAEDIAKVVSMWTGINVSKMLQGEREKLLNMEDAIHSRMIDQEEAVTAVSNAVRRARSGLQDRNRPIGSYIFLGPTGVGK